MAGVTQSLYSEFLHDLDKLKLPEEEKQKKINDFIAFFGQDLSNEREMKYPEETSDHDRK